MVYPDQIGCRLTGSLQQAYGLHYRLSRRSGDAGLIWQSVGISMKKIVLVAALLAMTGSAFAADMPLKAVKAPPPAPFDPWDIAFGGAVKIGRAHV